MSKLHALTGHGQSIWYDYIRRAFIISGDLQALVDQGVRGVTSNPSIFEKAIAGSADYDASLRPLVEAGKPVAEIYEALALADIQATADILRPVYELTGGRDGFVSLEVSPMLAHDTHGTVSDARRLHATLGRPNVMIKVPATPEGIPAITALIGEGISVNVTLIFSAQQYEVVAEAYLAGLELLAAQGGNLSQVASVASFFVSRVDTVVDAALEKIGERELQGKIAIANAKIAYARFRALFSGERWARLAAQGAQVQRPLWASTGSKNPSYPDTLYVDALIGPDTVNTVPPSTLLAFLDHGQVAATLEQGLAEAEVQVASVAGLGVDLDAIANKLLNEGVAAFVQSFETLTASIAGKREKLLAGRKALTASLGGYQPAVDAALAESGGDRIGAPSWPHDHTVWAPEPAEISNRLGWLHSPEVMADNMMRLQAFTDEMRAEGFTQALLLGMGGSSLAPEVFRRTFGMRDGYLDLSVLDSTDPDAVLAQTERLDLSKTLFIVSTKSGGTVETFSFFKFFYNRVAERVGRERAGAHFIAITDPGSGLAKTAQRYHFRATFLNDPDIGGGYSALSYFGLAPAALVGVDLATLLNRAQREVCNCEFCNCPVDGDNRGAQLGAILGELAKAGRDKLTFITSPTLASFGDWVEQLIAESTGKQGTGILPVVGEPVGAPGVYGKDRLFVYLRLAGDATHDADVVDLMAAGHPLVRLDLDDVYDVGGQFMLWEMATAIAGYRLGINPFDQPNVEAAKILSRQMVAAYAAHGALPVNESAPLSADTLSTFLAQAQFGDYITVQAYVQPTAETDAALLALRTRLRDTTRMATTVGYGPRFLHSTGQLHKGDAGNGLFIQLTADAARDAAIPDEASETASSMTFGVLKMAQAMGDKEALQNSGRHAIRLHLGQDAVKALVELDLDLGRAANAVRDASVLGSSR